jgi:hypothetical protein
VLSQEGVDEELKTGSRRTSQPGATSDLALAEEMRAGSITGRLHHGRVA